MSTRRETGATGAARILCNARQLIIPPHDQIVAAEEGQTGSLTVLRRRFHPSTRRARRCLCHVSQQAVTPLDPPTLCRAGPTPSLRVQAGEADEMESSEAPLGDFAEPDRVEYRSR